MSEAKNIAAMRWRAIEGFNYHCDLTPAARRVGISLISQMDVRTLACFPSEGRLAVFLGISLRAVKQAKAELKAKGLLTWTNPGGPRHKSRYEFNWAALDKARDAGIERAKLAREARAMVNATSPMEDNNA